MATIQGNSPKLASLCLGFSMVSCTPFSCRRPQSAILLGCTSWGRPSICNVTLFPLTVDFRQNYINLRTYFISNMTADFIVTAQFLIVRGSELYAICSMIIDCTLSTHPEIYAFALLAAGFGIGISYRVCR